MLKLLAALSLLPATALAYPDPSVCEPQARAQMQTHVDAYASLAKQYPQQFGKYACYEGQKVQLVSAKHDGDTMYGVPLYGYEYTIQCGDKTDTLSTQYYLHGNCEVSGE